MDYQPLLDPGFHDLPLDGLQEALRELFVEPFENQRHREYLTECLVRLVDEFRAIGIPLEIWVDGSYVTEKPIPKDIDVVVFFRSRDRRDLEDENRKRFETLYDHKMTQINYECDIYFEPIEIPDGVKYWLPWFGTSRLGTPKGIARIIIPEE